jgi:hypothetical protein
MTDPTGRRDRLSVFLQHRAACPTLTARGASSNNMPLHTSAMIPFVGRHAEVARLRRALI